MYVGCGGRISIIYKSDSDSAQDVRTLESDALQAATARFPSFDLVHARVQATRRPPRVMMRATGVRGARRRPRAPRSSGPDMIMGGVRTLLASLVPLGLLFLEGAAQQDSARGGDRGWVADAVYRMTTDELRAALSERVRCATAV